MHLNLKIHGTFFILTLSIIPSLECQAFVHHLFHFQECYSFLLLNFQPAGAWKGLSEVLHLFRLRSDLLSFQIKLLFVTLSSSTQQDGRAELLSFCVHT